MKLESIFIFTLSFSEITSLYYCECEIVSTQSERFEKIAVSCSETFFSLNHVTVIFDAMNSTLSILTKDKHFESMLQQAQKSAELRWNENNKERQKWNDLKQIKLIKRNSALCQMRSCIYIDCKRDESSEWKDMIMLLAWNVKHELKKRRAIMR